MVARKNSPPPAPPRSRERQRGGRVDAPMIIIPGQYAGKDEYNAGVAFRLPNFRDFRPGAAIPGNERWDFLVEETRAEERGLSWIGYMGFTVNPANFAADNKRELSIFFEHKSSGRFGAVLEARQMHLVGIEENNTQGRGARIDELMRLSLRAAKVDPSELQKRGFWRAFDRILEAFYQCVFDPAVQRNIDVLAERKLAKMGLLGGIVDRCMMYDTESGKATREYTEHFSGAIRTDKV